jgi:galactokinase
MGEYTDLAGGHVLPIAIPQVTKVWAAERSDRHLRVWSSKEGGAPVELVLDGPESPSGWSAYPLAVARALEAAGHHIGGADLLVDSDVPVGAGLSSSAALECSVAMALCSLFAIELAPMAVARVAQVAENDFVGMPCGIMDQAASMCCTAGHALLLDTRDLQVAQVPCALEELGMTWVIVDTGVKHDLVDSAYRERKASVEESARLLGVQALRDVPGDEVSAALEQLARSGDEVLVRRARHLLSEEQRVLEVAGYLRSGEPAAIGPVLLAGHRSLRDDFEVSCPELDMAVAAATEAGSYGARLTGAGFGGSVIALAPVGAVHAVEDAVQAAFQQRGWAPPQVSTVVPSGGARPGC